ncbi:Uu.00g044760.m01.CDS01 [Anthostomella pinea]|uniref:gamma-glutamylcyclotransferase n=1 Tax=Anthostomella pinea TaxID=933095 RepID=A0AAI8V5Z9_9PEZI|nr:Uu.00g044760.m01.CDS01 [Anthostomella pinea]
MNAHGSATVMEEGRGRDTRIEPYQQAQSLLQQIWASPHYRRRAPSPMSYPPISSIPRTSPERLALAPVDDPSATASTIFYLAYGSNLCAEIFLGVRGIRPISQINVSAPAFDLTFDLPGLPYQEPCFANTAPRRIPKPPPFDPPKLPPYTDYDDDAPSVAFPSLPDPGPTWNKGLFGVVYEVTPEDYATIVKTEGGGASYHDVLTPCLALPPAMRVPEKPPVPELPRPFLAHTLYAPRLPDLPGDDDDDDDGKDSHDENTGENGDIIRDDGDDGDHDPRKKKWFRKLLLPVRRPAPYYAQPSPRYLKLLRDGAAEHYLPDDYQAYLAALPAYTITTHRQAVGRFLFSLFAIPFIFALIRLRGLLSDGNGNVPRWFVVVMNVVFNLMWMLYDSVFKPVFGDGERTLEEDDDGGDEGGIGRGVGGIGAGGSRWGSEKSALLGDW